MALTYLARHKLADRTLALTDAQTERALAEPTAALPWHSMVLHQGGWPDGS